MDISSLVWTKFLVGLSQSAKEIANFHCECYSIFQQCRESQECSRMENDK